MYKRELDNLIQQQKVPQAIMLYGQSHFLIDRYTKLLSEKDDANILTLNSEEYSLKTASLHLSQGSLFGGDSVLVVKSLKRVQKKDLLSLIDLVKKSPNNCFIYAYYGENFSASATTAFKNRDSISVRFFDPTVQEARSTLIKESKLHGVDLDPYVATYLLETQNNNLALSINELSKLALLDSKIGTKEIDDMVFGSSQVKAEDIVDLILEGGEFLIPLEKAHSGGEDEIRIITLLITRIATLYLFKVSIKLDGVASSAKILGYRLPQHIEKSYHDASVRISEKRFASLLTLLLSVELKMKTDYTKAKSSLLISTLLKVQSILK